MIVAGVDAGVHGAICFLDTDNGDCAIYDSELTADRLLNCQWLLQLLLDKEPQRAVIEYCFKPLPLVRMLGRFEAVFDLASVPLEVVAVSKWKNKVLGENTKDKERSIKLCQQLYPQADLYRPTPAGRKKKLDDNRAEAVLLAHYLRLGL